MLRRFSPRHRVILSIEADVFGDSTQRIQCASRFVAEALIADHGVSRNRILLLPNAVDSERFGSPSALEAGRRLRIELDEKAEQIWLLPASGWRRKGLPLLFQALASIRDPRIHLWIAGRDDPRPWRRMASELGLSNQVLFMGQRDDLEVVYAAVDGMVLPTRYDAFANVTLEAAASGLPVITTQTNGAAEWLEAGLVLLEHADDLAGLVRALTTFADSERRIDFGRRAQEQARRLTWARHVEQLRDEYRRIVDAREVRKYR